MEWIIQDKERYPVPECEVLEMVPERVVAASGGLSDDEFEIIKW